MATDTYLVKALYSFKGKNNDELCFKKGDIITVTQREEGGWWEGTLGETTGWFPNNYVVEYKEPSGSAATSPVRAPSEIQAFRNVVLKDIIDSERAHVGELQGLVLNFLQGLEKSNILTKDEFRQLTGNIGEILETHKHLLSLIEECGSKSGPEQRVGGLFLQWATRIKTVHQTYCAGHPRAVCILDKYKDELNTLMEQLGASCPGLLVLTAGLSKPFRRLGKYAAMLQELARHVHEAHPDRGDTHRAVAVYKDIATHCASVRRQKELELQVVTGTVRGWPGAETGSGVSELGEVIHMGGVAVGDAHADRYLVLFPTSLLVLSVSRRMSAFVYEGCLPLTGIKVKKLEDTDVQKNAFEIAGPMIDTITAVCQTKAEADNWVEMLQKYSNPGSISMENTTGQPNSLPHMSPANNVSQMSFSTNHKRSHSFNNHHSYTQHLQQNMQQAQQQNQYLKNQHQRNTSNRLLSSCDSLSQTTSRLTGAFMAPKFLSVDYLDKSGTSGTTKGWSLMSLRPAPPLRPQATSDSMGTPDDSSAPTYPYLPHQRKSNSYEEDALILKVIEAYCTSARSRNAVNSVDLGHLSRGNVQTYAHLTNKVHPNNLHHHNNNGYELDVCFNLKPLSIRTGSAKVRRNNSSMAGDPSRMNKVPETRKLLSERKFKLNRSNPSLTDLSTWSGINVKDDFKRKGSVSPSFIVETRRGGSQPILLPEIHDSLPRGARSSTWCCGTFVKQMRKSHHFD